MRNILFLTSIAVNITCFVTSYGGPCIFFWRIFQPLFISYMKNDDWSIFGRGNERARWMCCSWSAYLFFTVGHWSIFKEGMSAQRQHHAFRAHSLLGKRRISLLHQIGPNISNAMAQIVGISVGGSTLKSTKDRFSYGVWKWGEHPAP